MHSERSTIGTVVGALSSNTPVMQGFESPNLMLKILASCTPVYYNIFMKSTTGKIVKFGLQML